MIFVGVDIVKYTHYEIVIESDGEINLKPFRFEKREGLLLFISRLAQWSKEDLR